MGRTPHNTKKYKIKCLQRQWVNRVTSRNRPTTNISFLIYDFWDHILLYTPSWPQTQNPPASAFQVLGLQVCTTIIGPNIQSVSQWSWYQLCIRPEAWFSGSPVHQAWPCTPIHQMVKAVVQYGYTERNKETSILRPVFRGKNFRIIQKRNKSEGKQCAQSSSLGQTMVRLIIILGWIYGASSVIRKLLLPGVVSTSVTRCIWIRLVTAPLY
jgi:hypothetical protein